MRLFGKVFPIWMVILYALALAAVLAWPCVAFGSAFAFDSPQTNVPATLRVVGIILAYPILPIGGVIGSLLAYRGDHKRLTYALLAVALVPFVVFILLLLWSTIEQIIFLVRPPSF